VFAAGPRLTGTTTEGCVAQAVPEVATLYEIGPPVDGSVFPTVTMRDE